MSEELAVVIVGNCTREEAEAKAKTQVFPAIRERFGDSEQRFFRVASAKPFVNATLRMDGEMVPGLSGWRVTFDTWTGYFCGYMSL